MLAIALPAGADPGTSLAVEHGDYFAVRMNLTSSDAFINVQKVSCVRSSETFDEFVAGQIVVVDGQVSLKNGVWVSSATPAFASAQVGYGVGSETVGFSPRGPGSTSGRVDSWGGPLVSQSLTVVFVWGQHPCVFNVWTNGTGVESWDVHVGQATLKTLQSFETAVGAREVTALPFQQVDATVVARDAPTTHRDTVGWFWPEFRSSWYATVDWSCRVNGADCPTNPPGWGQDWIALSAPGGAAWEFSVTGSVQEGWGHTALGLVELPDDSYLE